MNAVELVYRALPAEEPPESPQDGVCCVTGDYGPTIARKHAISQTFTNLDILRAPNSDRVGLPAWRAITYTTPNEGKKRELAPLRQSHWMCDGKSLTTLDRVGVRNLVLASDPPAPTWAGYATTSYKKHGVLLAPVNVGSRRVWLWETRLVDCSNVQQVQDTWARLRAAQDAGMPRPLIEQLDISPAFMAKIGWRVWQEFYRWAFPRRNAQLYQFLTFLLPSQEELKNAAEK